MCRIIFLIFHSNNNLPIGPIQPSSPSTKKLLGPTLGHPVLDTHVGDVDIVEEEGGDADVGRDDEQDKDEDAKEPALLHHHRVG